MGLFNNTYPYTDFHELNLDWVLSQTKDLKAQVEILIERYKNVDELVELANKYTDSEISKVKTLINVNTKELESLNTRLDEQIALLESRITQEVTDINVTMDTRYLRVQQMITQQWEDMKTYIAGQVFDVKVRNFFTGELVSLQSMFDYLARLHSTDAGSYAEVTGHNTYQHYVDKHETYTNVVLGSRAFFNT